MNKIYKLVWSKTKNMYVAVAEFAKSHTKTLKFGVISRTLAASMLACVMSFGVNTVSYAAVATGFGNTFSIPTGQGDNWIVIGAVNNANSSNNATIVFENVKGGAVINPSNLTTGDWTMKYNNFDPSDEWFFSEQTRTQWFAFNGGLTATEIETEIKKLVQNGTIGSGKAIKDMTVSGNKINYTRSDGTTGSITLQDNDTKYSAGSGVSLSGTTFSAKAGTNVTVNANGISVTGNGTVANGNTGLIDGGKLYTEVRPADNGNYVKSSFTII